MDANRKKTIILTLGGISSAALACWMFATSIGMHANSRPTAMVVATAALGVVLLGLAVADFAAIYLARRRTRREAVPSHEEVVRAHCERMEAAEREAQAHAGVMCTVSLDEARQLYPDPAADRGDDYAGDIPEDSIPSRPDHTSAVAGEQLERGDLVYLSTPSSPSGDDALRHMLSVSGETGEWWRPEPSPTFDKQEREDLKNRMASMLLRKVNTSAYLSDRPPAADALREKLALQPFVPLEFGIDPGAPGGDETAYALHDPSLPGHATRRHGGMMSARSMLTGAAAVRADRREIRERWQRERIDELTPVGRERLPEVLGCSELHRLEPGAVRAQVLQLQEANQFLRIGSAGGALEAAPLPQQLHVEQAVRLAEQFGERLADAIEENQRLRTHVIGHVAMTTDAARALSNMGEIREEVIALHDATRDYQLADWLQQRIDHLRDLVEPAAPEGSGPAE